MHIVLVEPEIPQNTGNIARTCALTGTTLHLVKPLGFSVEDRYLKRAGLDYWDQVEVRIWENFAKLAQDFAEHRFFLATTHAAHSYHELPIPAGRPVGVRPGDPRSAPAILAAYPRQPRSAFPCAIWAAP